jgi:hypothetical protein
MRLVKMFKTIESELWSMESEINKWVEDTGATIVQVTGNIAPQTGSASVLLSTNRQSKAVQSQLPEGRSSG